MPSTYTTLSASLREYLVNERNQGISEEIRIATASELCAEVAQAGSMNISERERTGEFYRMLI